MTSVLLSALAGVAAAVLALVAFVVVVGAAPLADAAATGSYFVPAVATLGSVMLLAVAPTSEAHSAVAGQAAT